MTAVSILEVTEHVQNGAWLAGELLGAEVEARDRMLTIRGVGLDPQREARGS